MDILANSKIATGFLRSVSVLIGAVVTYLSVNFGSGTSNILDFIGLPILTVIVFTILDGYLVKKWEIKFNEEHKSIIVLPVLIGIVIGYMGFKLVYWRQL